MGDPEGPGEALPNRLSNRDTIQLPDELSLSDSDPEDALSMPFAQRVEDLSSSSNDNDDDDDDDVIEVKGPKLRGIATVPPLGRGSSTGDDDSGGGGGGGGVFQLRGGSLGFSDRSRNIFESLESAVKLTSAQLGDDNVLSGTFARPAPPSPPGERRSSGRQSPPGGRSRRQSTSPKRQSEHSSRHSLSQQQHPHRHKGAAKGSGSRVPDYLEHPERWTRYSLDDVAETSDRHNSQVALSFLQDLRKRREEREGRHDRDDDEPFVPSFNQSQASADGGGDHQQQQQQHKIVFSKPKQQQQGSREEAGGGGRKGAPERRARVGLLHLGEEEDEEDARPEEADHQHSVSPSANKGARKRKWAPSRKWGQEDEDEDEDDEEGEKEEDEEEGMADKPGSVAFSISKKVNRKHIRKMAEPRHHDEED